ncbi:ASCH domain-containing protein [Lysinibacillus capsici]|uniref:ASCH domain-containing protein n=1 Tax=Lysinibacillus capsici TaxID=2115968 RepID=UPI0032E476F8
MKALTIQQPWALLIALKLKEFETRSWQTKYRGPIAIHASKTINYEACSVPEIKELLIKYGFYNIDLIPTGCVIATAVIVDCYKVTKDRGATAEIIGGYITECEYLLGDYTEGRFAWKLEQVQMMTTPVPAKGKLSLWEWERPS